MLTVDNFLCFPSIVCFLFPPYSLTLSTMRTTTMTTTRGKDTVARVELSFFDWQYKERKVAEYWGATEVERWILPSIFKFRIERRRRKERAWRQEGWKRRTQVTDVVSLTLILRVITFFQFEGKRSASARFRHRTPENLFPFPLAFLRLHRFKLHRRVCSSNSHLQAVSLRNFFLYLKT